MDPTTIRKADEIFQQVLDLPADQREAVLERRCAGDKELRGFVEQLLSHDAEGMGEFLCRPILASGDDEPVDLEADMPEWIGHYHIVRVIGEGGMGVVYLAEQAEPLKRQVALKVIKLGMDTRQVIARFESERQALAMMHHPNVAQVFDAGVTPDGRPFFVMEYVPGTLITEFSDAHQLSVSERLALFMLVCHAIHHAHQNGIIHRDIKPSNLLVAADNGTPIPKVIDFGVAKAVKQRLTERTLFTEQGQLIGTPAYMSPEQAGGGGNGVDTRTDIYSLGALLYELLAGCPPFDPETLRQHPFDEICRTIREDEPLRPSTKFGHVDAELKAKPRDPSSTAAEIARGRSTDPTALKRRLRGDLDWITMKAMEKDVARRYESAAEMAADVQRHLDHEPVLAGPPSAGYRFRKFVRRNRAFVTGAAAVLLVLVAGIAFTTTFAVGQARARAEAEAARDEAQRQANIAEAVNEFLNDDLLTAVRPEEQGRDITVREVLDNASGAIAGRFEGEPAVEGAIRKTLGVTYQSLGEYEKAEEHLRTSLALRRAAFGERHAEVADGLHHLAGLLYRNGNLVEAEPLYRQALEMQQSLLGREHPDVAPTLNDLAALVAAQGDYERAKEYFQQALVIHRKAHGEEHPEVAVTLHNIASIVHALGELDEAASLYREAIAMKRKFYGDEHPNLTDSQNNLARVLEAKGEVEEAEELHRATLATRRKLLGNDHPDVAGSLNNLANLLRKKGEFDEAQLLCREGLEIRRAALSPAHPNIARSLRLMGAIMLDAGKPSEAEPYIRECFEIRSKSLPEGHHLIPDAESVLGETIFRQGHHADAEKHLLAGYEGLHSKLGAADGRTKAAGNRIIELYEAWEKPDEAEKWRGRLEEGAEQPKP